MSSTIVSALAGGLFGIALAAPPGPMNAIIAEESVLRGWEAGFKAGLGAMLADVLFCVLAFVGLVAVVETNPTLEGVLFLAGGTLMVVFAVDALREAREATSFTGDLEADSAGFRKAFALSLTNPYQIAFWLTVGVGLLESGTLDVFAHVPGVSDALAGAVLVETGSPALLVGFFGGIAAWILAYPAVLVSARRRVDALAPVVALLSGVVLGGFGLLFLWIGANGLL